MTDKEMLELAAKAVGFIDDQTSDDDYAKGLRRNGQGIYYFVHDRGWRNWSPLTDDGDEARLEATLRLDVEWGDSSVVVSRFELGACEPYGDDKQAARRLAGVRAAAEIGKSMQ